MRLLNLDGTRAVDDDPPFGIACYKGSLEGDEDLVPGGQSQEVFRGLHWGVVNSVEDARAFLEGDDHPPTLMHVWQGLRPELAEPCELHP